ncbi:LysE/ArgO family amino acid transporter [Lactiplantibacillus pentosus]|uniref:LysE/ArgO family amino acid transporter n=1 Tax=Lactiplantibacillus pentosus TaxID=1589 RepID=UPI001C1FEBA1|nr:LysE family transporter [Lactiplantibacillus pentosus]MBU7463820.1 LysE family transporter [Lactiplantibacillus pentosus]MBU7489921.1 LysE family transporter [Lactiplantibacillus pentosus]MBU7525761.1 LysE family transporter [Lactiplantibacillus pentosus]MDT6965366.1 LysE family transporter [Lactiplantibacillus pentosus]MDT7001564.1 LysE family transporter [Lactiplantibacillus pentosus]
MQVFLQGLLFGIVYIAPIGMQNLFVVSTAIEQPLQRALRVALIVIAFDTSLSLACFYGIGKLLQTTPWLELAVLFVGSLLVFYIGLHLLRQPEAAMDTLDSDFSYKAAILTAFSVAWLNPQALIDGSVLLAAFRVSIPAALTHFFIAGVIIASVIWFIGLTSLISKFKHLMRPRVLLWINRVCGLIIILYGIKLLANFVTKI